MALLFSPKQYQATVRPFQYRDLETIEQLYLSNFPEEGEFLEVATQDIQTLRHWYGVVKFLSWFPNPFQHLSDIYVAEVEGKVQGLIWVSPFNQTRSTWKVNQVAVEPGTGFSAIGSQLLRHCFETVWEARNWLLEVNVNDKNHIALYRQNGFQRLAQMTAWSIDPVRLREIASTQPDLPNLLPVSNADAQILYQLDTLSMPPFLRQIYDRHVIDFRTSVVQAVMEGFRQWVNKTEQVSGYVFELQRKAAIGYFQVQFSQDGSKPHVAELTVNPAYTWLYPELLSQIAHLAQDFPAQSLRLMSADYLPEREAYLEKIGAHPIEHTLLMSRSVWHKVRESRISLDGLQLPDVLQGLQPVHKPVPGPMSWLGPMDPPPTKKHPLPDTLGGNGNRSDFSDSDPTQKSPESPTE
ncbi:MAG: GNAT family N-acetyltransferase [Oscillatoriales cyanobacterium RM2_1_1]|nr:GNAT family N-acetyltransferase [Oscillatoriales cyanobacterium SM2_3_0]NJO46687.1 GNAT family N-acetyltransferase [Oscillatoriales cyanobacterium RM2_1_1]